MRARRIVATAIAGAVTGALALATLAGPVLAKDGDVIRVGACSGRSDWKLKLSDEDGRIEVEYEVDQNRVGDTWRVRIRHDGDLVFAGQRITRGPSGSFEVRILQRDRAGDDVFTARAVNTRTGEVCGGRAVWTA
jgi:hypothetical protein